MSRDGTEQVRADADLRPGQIVGGRYRVDRLIAEGGMATVWSGQNVHMGKQVALKVIRRSFAAHDVATEMFRRESIAASMVNHPNVVSVFDVTEHDGMTCIVMELLEGESLADYLARQGTLTIDEAASLLLPAMRGVSAAHAQGIVHRDLKPANIFLCRDKDGSLLTTKVLDFGISKVTGRAPDAGSDLTDFAHFGTPGYMAPEDIAGAMSVDPRSDVYAFGVILFEALTGTRPFAGEPSLALLYRILTEPAPTLGSVRPDLPLDVESIVNRALAKEPQHRFPSIESLIQTIDNYLMRAPTMRVSLPQITKGRPSQPTLRMIQEPSALLAAAPETVHAATVADRIRSLCGAAKRLPFRRALDWRLGVAAGLLAGSFFWARYALDDAFGPQVEPATLHARPTIQPLPTDVEEQLPVVTALPGTPASEQKALQPSTPRPATSAPPSATRETRSLRRASVAAPAPAPIVRAAHNAVSDRQDASDSDPFEQAAPRPRRAAPVRASDDDPFVNYGKIERR